VLLLLTIASCKQIAHNIIRSDTNERPETENGTVYSHDSGYENECCPASPITVPSLRPRLNSVNAKPRRQRTTSTSQNTIRANEAIIRCNQRTIYTAGRPVSN
jgi:hypothetical protein